MIKNLFYYLLFIIVGIILTIVFATSTSYTQLIFASLFYPPLAFLIFKNIPLKNPKPLTQSNPSPVTPDNVDSDKRAFLKLIGAAGLSYFLYSLFSKRPESFFINNGNLPTNITDANNSKNDDIKYSQPTDGYQITEIDEGSDIYTGFTNHLGAWYIMKADTQIGSFRYSKGESNFPSNWSNRQKLNYDYFYKVFGQY